MNKTAILTAIIGFLLGLAFGWGWRSSQFGRDRECANPNHVLDPRLLEGDDEPSDGKET